MKKKKVILILGLTAIITGSCNNQSNSSSATTDSTDQSTTGMENNVKGTFGYDLNFLKSKDSGLIVLNSPYDSSQIIISPKYQAKVFTSTADGAGGLSFGWVNYKAFDGPLDTHMNGYGGEDRLWLGPEGGRFSLFFKPGVKQEFNDWHTPAPIDSEPWKLTQQNTNGVTMEKDMQLQNYAGTQLNMKVERGIELLDKESMARQLDFDVNKLKAVAFQTINSITNTGTNAWTETTGAPCTWNLDMFAPSEKCTIVIPYINEGSGKVATTDYFGKIPDDRIKWGNGILYFKADGKSRGKMGIPPARAKNVAGSYDAVNKVLTITKFDVKSNGKFLNQEWRTDREPYSGDAMNAYNDGPLADGTQMGPFYEIESVSPAAFLKPGEKITHQHNVYHFMGDSIVLNELAKKVLGVSIEEIEKAF